jgi:hypothetical protein
LPISGRVRIAIPKVYITLIHSLPLEMCLLDGVDIPLTLHIKITPMSIL